MADTAHNTPCIQHSGTRVGKLVTVINSCILSSQLFVHHIHIPLFPHSNTKQQKHIAFETTYPHMCKTHHELKLHPGASNSGATVLSALKV